MKTIIKLIAFLVMLTMFLLFLQDASAQRKLSTGYHVLELSYVSLNVADIALTQRILKLGGHECNPIMQNNKLMIPIKIASTGSFLLLNRLLAHQDKRAGMATLIIGNLIYSGVVFHNYTVYLAIKI